MKHVTHRANEQALDLMDDDDSPSLEPKVEAALELVGMFLESTAACVIPPDDIPGGGGAQMMQRALSAKECAAYNAALNFLECYMDRDQ